MIGTALSTVLLQAAVTANVTVRTRAAHNPAPKVWYRVPEGYKPVKGRAWRTLVIFGGRNCVGEAEVSGKLGWTQWADRHGVFLVAPGFKDDKYWDPQTWSGRALLTALAEIRKSYDIDTSKLLYLRRRGRGVPTSETETLGTPATDVGVGGGLARSSLSAPLRETKNRLAGCDKRDPAPILESLPPASPLPS